MHICAVVSAALQPVSLPHAVSCALHIAATQVPQPVSGQPGPGTALQHAMVVPVEVVVEVIPVPVVVVPAPVVVVPVAVPVVVVVAVVVPVVAWVPVDVVEVEPPAAVVDPPLQPTAMRTIAATEHKKPPRPRVIARVTSRRRKLPGASLTGSRRAAG